eukprot:CAMPEP_0174265922 /NCGR_PEP_ID=MMETSP0439-20130205/28451_1 /TAXON_ID=0 /ORGANISM="Stereomyxa ramosa, Strain Chinc5" /LENGTH=461 /DNA_ID=CAMNT_0015352617 /DNA_START=67 /DNA_END=1452 /DNA_ORIENTATION=+
MRAEGEHRQPLPKPSFKAFDVVEVLVKDSWFFATVKYMSLQDDVVGVSWFAEQGKVLNVSRTSIRNSGGRIISGRVIKQRMLVPGKGPAPPLDLFAYSLTEKNSIEEEIYQQKKKSKRLSVDVAEISRKRTLSQSAPLEGENVRLNKSRDDAGSPCEATSKKPISYSQNVSLDRPTSLQDYESYQQRKKTKKSGFRLRKISMSPRPKTKDRRGELKSYSLDTKKLAASANNGHKKSRKYSNRTVPVITTPPRRLTPYDGGVMVIKSPRANKKKLKNLSSPRQKEPPKVKRSKTKDLEPTSTSSPSLSRFSPPSQLPISASDSCIDIGQKGKGSWITANMLSSSGSPSRPYLSTSLTQEGRRKFFSPQPRKRVGDDNNEHQNSTNDNELQNHSFHNEGNQSSTSSQNDGDHPQLCNENPTAGEQKEFDGQQLDITHTIKKKERKKEGSPYKNSNHKTKKKKL